MNVNNYNSINTFLQDLRLKQGEMEICIKFPNFDSSLSVNELWIIFLNFYEIVNFKKFRITIESKKIVFTILYYFLKKENFYNSPSIYRTGSCEVSLNKGLIIVGGFGVGKTTILKTISLMIEKLSLNFYSNPVRMHNTIDIVEDFENSNFNCRNDVINKYSKSFRIFDDIKNEREASNFGKVDLFKEILYKRCENKNFNTILLCNYDSEYPNDMQQAIESFGRYGDRVYDRLFEAFNFIEFKGKSNR